MGSIMKRSMVAAALALVLPVAVSAQYGAEKDIVETAVEAGQFTTLAKALQAAGLVEALQGEGPFTVFAPTDAAFAKLPAGTLESLLADKAALTSVLTYHVVSGSVMSGEVVQLSSAQTLEGSSVSIAVRNGNVMVDGATVVNADVRASNGVIHVIDSVILPPSLRGDR